jgi:outer membrane protein assembly factor BamB
MNSGQSPVGGAVGSLSWTTAVPAALFSSPAIGADGTVYVGAGTTLYALDKTTGSIKWVFPTNGLIYGTPAVGADGSVYIGSGDNNVYSVNGSTGAQNWVFTTGGIVVSSPAVGLDNTVYFGSYEGGAANGHLYAVKGGTGALKWSLSTAAIVSSPALDGSGNLYVGSCDNNVYSLSTLDGSKNWSFATTGHVEAAPAVSASGTIYVNSDDGSIYAIDSQTGLKVWSYNMSSGIGSTPSIISSPALGNGLVYVGSFDESVYAFDATAGTLAWSFKTAASVRASPVVAADGNVYTGAGDGFIYALDGTTGVSNWSVSVGGNSVVSPAIGADGSLYITNGSGVVALQSVYLTSLAIAPGEVVAGQSPTGTLTLNNAAPTGGLTVTLSGGDGNESFPATVLIPAGQSSATFTISTTGVDASDSTTITATLNGISSTANLTIDPATLSSISIQPTQILGGFAATGTLTLNGPAGPSAVKILLANGSKNTSTEPDVFVEAGDTSTSFTIHTLPVTNQTSATVTASLGTTTETATIQLNPVKVVSITATPASSTYTVEVDIDNVNPGGDTVVNLTSSSAAFVLPKTITVPAGDTSASLSVTPAAVLKATTVKLTATYFASSVSTSFDLQPASIASITFNPSTVTVGSSSTGTVTLTSVAPAGGSSIKLTSSVSTVKAPAQVTVHEGQTSVTFNVTTSASTKVGEATITGTLNNVSQTGTLQLIQVIELSNFTISPDTIVGGSIAAGTVTLSAAVVDPNGYQVNLSTTDANIILPTPAQLVIQKGQSTATFSINSKAVDLEDVASIAVSLGHATKTAKLTLEPYKPLSLTLNPSTIEAGGTTIATVTINGVAPTSGVTVKLKSGNDAVSVPSTVQVPNGKNSVQFNVAAVHASKNPVEIDAAIGKTSVTASLTISDNVSLQSMVFSPTELLGGGETNLKLTLNEAPTSDKFINVQLPSGFSKSSVTLLIPAGKTSVSEKIETPAVDKLTTYNLTATLGQTVSATLTLDPIEVSALTLSPSTVAIGSDAVGTVTLNSETPSPFQVELSSSSGRLSMPATVTVPAGKSTVTFKISTQAVSAAQTFTVTAGTKAGSQSALLNVTAGITATATFNPADILGGETVQGSFKLAQVQTELVTISYTTDSSKIPGGILIIPAGATGYDFKVATPEVTATTTVTFTFTGRGVVTTTAGLKLEPLLVSSVVLSPTTVSEGFKVNGTVTLNNPALASTVVKLTYGGLTQGPASVTVAKGKSSVTFSAFAGHTTTQATQSATATLNGSSATGDVTVVPGVQLTSVTFSPATVKSGSKTTLKISLSGPVNGTAVVKLTTSSSSILPLPASISIANHDSGTLTITAGKVSAKTVVTVTATYNSTTVTGTITISP